MRATTRSAARKTGMPSCSAMLTAPSAGNDSGRRFSGGRFNVRSAIAWTLPFQLWICHRPAASSWTVAATGTANWRWAHDSTRVTAISSRPRSATRRTSQSFQRRTAFDDRQVAEVLVQGDQDPSLCHCLIENRLVPRIGVQVADRSDVVTSRLDDRARGAVDTAIQQHVHQALSSSMRSCPTIRRANSRQANTSSRSSQS